MQFQHEQVYFLCILFEFAQIPRFVLKLRHKHKINVCLLAGKKISQQTVSKRHVVEVSTSM